MKFLQNFKTGAQIIFKRMQQKSFWQNVAKISIPFFVMVVVISLLINSSQDIFSGNFNNVKRTNFSDGKWISFWSLKVCVSLFYGLWLTNKKMN